MQAREHCLYSLLARVPCSRSVWQQQGTNEAGETIETYAADCQQIQSTRASRGCPWVLDPFSGFVPSACFPEFLSFAVFSCSEVVLQISGIAVSNLPGVVPVLPGATNLCWNKQRSNQFQGQCRTQWRLTRNNRNTKGSHKVCPQFFSEQGKPAAPQLFYGMQFATNHTFPPPALPSPIT